MNYRRHIVSVLNVALIIPPSFATRRKPPAQTHVFRACTHQKRYALGGIELAVDATDSYHQVFHISESIPTQPGCAVTLFYPEWEPASHAPTASVAELSGLVIHADGRRIEWMRDEVHPHEFHVNVPRNANTIKLEFDFLAPSSAALLRRDMVAVPWHRLFLYPASYSLTDIPVNARLTLAAGLHPFSPIEISGIRGSTLILAPTTLARLVDNPIYAGRFWGQRSLGEDGNASVRLDVLADHEAEVAIPTDEETKLRNVVAQTAIVFGRAPFRHYDAIVTLSDILSPGGGVEHTEEGENNLPASYFIDLPHQLMNRDLLVHEYVHAWNGRFRQPAGLATENLNDPVRNSLLWVYEGQTEFWGRVIGARSALRSNQETLDRLAMDAAVVANRKGRAWKTLEDSNNDPLYMAGHPVAWRDWQRREDYYPEGVLVWLNVDARLRELTGERKGLDDFAHLFFNTHGLTGTVSTYTFNDVCTALNSIAKNDWAKMLRHQLRSHDNADAMAGLMLAGWRLQYDDFPSESFRQDEQESGVSNLDYSIGLEVRADGNVRSVAWDSAAFRAGLAPGARIVTVNGESFSVERLLTAVQNAHVAALSLTFEVNGSAVSATVAYCGSLRYPHLERLPGTTDRLTPLLVPRH